MGNRRISVYPCQISLKRGDQLCAPRRASELNQALDIIEDLFMAFAHLPEGEPSPAEKGGQRRQTGLTKEVNPQRSAWEDPVYVWTMLVSSTKRRTRFSAPMMRWRDGF